MKSILLYTLSFLFLLMFVGNKPMQAANGTVESICAKNKIDPDKSKEVDQRGKGEGEGEEDERDQEKKRKEKEAEKKRRIAKNDDSSFSMLKDLFQSTFDFFYAPDSTSKSDDIGKQR
ncbi:MAG: hypothetical protein AAF696_08740 [Bacteroidota bacterium]